MAQDHSIIGFITKKYKSTEGISILLNESKIGTIVKNEYLEYTIFSEGRIVVTFLIGNDRETQIIEVKPNSKYYFDISSTFSGTTQYKIIDSLTANEKIMTIGKIVKIGEDSENQVGYESKSKQHKKSQATCFLINEEGYFLTNFHCIENAKEITIKGIDGDFTTKYGATLIASDPSNDLALLKINNKNVKFNIPPYAIRSSGVAQAEKVYALGFPMAEAMGQEMKITDGIISAKSGVHGDISKFQISASVNPGNSGGPLIDDQGNLIGVIYAKSTVAESAGYAIKASYLESFLKNVEGFNFTNLTNNLMDKSFTDKINLLKAYIYIIETN